MAKEKFVIYSVISPHMGESVNSILDRKLSESERAPYSLWSLKFNSWTKLEELINSGQLGKEDKLIVYAKYKVGRSDFLLV